jgi:hypothetical protein
MGGTASRGNKDSALPVVEVCCAGAVSIESGQPFVGGLDAKTQFSFCGPTPGSARLNVGGGVCGARFLGGPAISRAGRVGEAVAGCEMVEPFASSAAGGMAVGHTIVRPVLSLIHVPGTPLSTISFWDE